ncbi:putative toxin-antitoxin system toxin component, PIN family [bacterium]|nr:putative toxin-antitoxin system toxin component, PIN family [bacterium]
MRVILDTNVFISGVFFGGQPGKILAAWRDGKVRLVLSTEILEEYVEVLRRLEKLYPPVEVKPVIELILAGSEIITVLPLEKPVCSDPDDDKFIACAMASKARVVVSGDKHLLVMDGIYGLEILTPSVFYKEYLK